MPTVKMFSWLASYWWTPTSEIPLPPPLPVTPVKVFESRPIPLRSTKITPLLITPQEIGIKRRALRRVPEEAKSKFVPQGQPVFDHASRLRPVPEASKNQYRQTVVLGEMSQSIKPELTLEHNLNSFSVAC